MVVDMTEMQSIGSGAKKSEVEESYEVEGRRSYADGGARDYVADATRYPTLINARTGGSTS